MRLSRRRLLRIAGLGALWGLFGFKTFRPDPLPPGERATLAAFLDVLIPADESPSATQLDIHLKILRRAEKDVSYWLMLKQGCRWLDKRARDAGRPAFPELAPPQQESLVEQAATNPGAPGIKDFFQTLRDDAFRLYYADPRSWAGLGGYSGPPQPLGFPDYTHPPRKSQRV
jgi:hypothetical protein